MHTSPIASPGSADAGGMNVVELNSALALGRAGHRVDLITRRDGPVAPVTELAENVRLFALPAGPPEPVAKSQQECFLEPFAAEFKNWIANHPGVDIVHSHHWFSGVAALETTHDAGIPHLQSFHSVAAPATATDLSAGEPAESSGRIAGEQHVARLSEIVVAVSEAEKQTILDRYSPAKERIKVVRPGVDTRLFRPLEADEEHWSKDCYLLFAARLQPLKGPDLAIETLAALDQENMHLVIAGAASADFAGYVAELHTLVDQLGLSERVNYQGSLTRTELARMIRAACVLVNPSYSETFGLINLEAAASGVPVVATKAGGIVESVQDGVTGLLIDNRNPQSWAQAIKRLTGANSQRAQFAKAARKFALTRTWDTVASELTSTYMSALG